jgi:hypothetical protein
MAIPAKVPGQSPQLGFSVVIGWQRTETPYLLQTPIPYIGSRSTPLDRLAEGKR